MGTSHPISAIWWIWNLAIFYIRAVELHHLVMIGDNSPFLMSCCYEISNDYYPQLPNLSHCSFSRCDRKLIFMVFDIYFSPYHIGLCQEIIYINRYQFPCKFLLYRVEMGTQWSSIISLRPHTVASRASPSLRT